MAHTISSGLVSGKIYTFKFRSENSIGFSEFSGLSRYAIALPPGKPTKPVKDMARSTQTSIYVTWSESAATQVPILGYKLYMSKGTSEYELVYHENNNPLIREFNATGLETGALYQFRVAAINFNGDSEWSDALHKYSCQLPKQPEAPYRLSGTRTKLTLRWLIPAEDGGCPLTGFNLFRDDGASGSITTEVDNADFEGVPSKTQH